MTYERNDTARKRNHIRNNVGQKHLSNVAQGHYYNNPSEQPPISSEQTNHSNRKPHSENLTDPSRLAFL